MQITLVDDSIPFDGYTAASRALGGAEKAFAALPGALARRGHTVTAMNRCRWPMVVEGVRWEPLDTGEKPFATDVLIAFRKPSLLQFMRQARRRVLWHTGAGSMLDRPAVRRLIDDHRPLVLLLNPAQRAGLPPLPGAALLPPAVNRDFLTPAPLPIDLDDAAPRAIVTTHPNQGLGWLLDLWVTRIRPAVPLAQLHVYSLSLAQAAGGARLDGDLQSVADQALAAGDQGVSIHEPQGDAQMAAAYARAAVHLYPGHPDDMTAFTLLESQACGIPAVIRPLGAAPDRIANGVSGMIAPDDDAFANLTALLLSDPAARAPFAAEARARSQGLTWDAAAAAFEAMVS